MTKRAGGKTTREQRPKKLGAEAKRPTGKISDVFGLLRDKTSRRLTIDEINEIAADGWAGRRR